MTDKVSYLFSSRDLTVELSLLRHGMTTAGKRYIGSTDVPLTHDGWQQMALGCAQLNDVQAVISDTANSASISLTTEHSPCYWDAVVSSPLLRCRQFAEKFAELESIPLVIEPGFKEIHFGLMENLTAIEVMNKHPGVLEAFWQDPLASPPEGGEPLQGFHARVLEALVRLKNRFHGKKVLLVTHGGVIRSVLCHLENKPVAKMLEIEVAHGDLVTKCI